MTKLTLAAVLLAAPLAARADIGLRLGADASIAYSDANGTHAITDNWPLGADVMLSWWLPTSLLSLDAELGEQFQVSPATGTRGRVGTVGVHEQHLRVADQRDRGQQDERGDDGEDHQCLAPLCIAMAGLRVGDWVVPRSPYTWAPPRM